MAKVDVLHTPKDGSFLFYNLDADVGRGGVNRKDDVLLVHTPLKTSADVPGNFQGRVFARSFRDEPILIKPLHTNIA
jgi:hypothetical protein